MREAARWAWAILLLVACAPQTAAPTSPSPRAASAAIVDRAALDHVYGSYQTADGGLLVVARLGWFADARDSTFRSLYAGGAPGRMTVGPGFKLPSPTAAVLNFGETSLTISSGGRATTAPRLTLKATDVEVSAVGARLTATITEAPGPGPHPGIVLVHGSEPGQRYFYDFWVGLYTSLGITVLTYDKRGVGQSTGTYGEYAAEDRLIQLADDASAALDLLAAWPGVDPKRVGFQGSSQGGWIVPLAIARHGRGAFAILLSAPAVTVGQQGIWNDFSSGGATVPKETEDAMLAAVRKDRSGYDPAPALAKLRAPSLWVLGRHDRNVPTALSIENLRALNNAAVTIIDAGSGHSLLQSQTGLLVDDDRAPGFAPEVIPGISTWVRKVVS